VIPPSYVNIPDRYASLGSEAIDWCKRGGWEFDAEQEYCIDAFMSVDRRMQWTAQEACVVVARQNGKTNRILIPRALWQFFLGPKDDVFWTAHRAVTSTQAFRDIRALIDSNDFMSRKVKGFVATYGKETIQHVDGRIMRFLARSESGGRGLGGPLPVMDEAFALEEGQLGALMPTILARPDAQLLYGSSAGLSKSAHLRELRDRGRSGNDPGLVYVEWCASGDWDNPGCRLKGCDHHRSRSGCAMDDERNWQQANFALDRRIMRPTVRTLRRSLAAQQFGREVLTWWDKAPDEETKLPISSTDFDLCEDQESSVQGQIIISVDVSTNSDYGCIGIAAINAQGLPHVELIKYETGIDWMVPEVLRLRGKYILRRINIAQGRDRDLPQNKVFRSAIILDPAGPAAVLLPKLRERGIEPILMNTRDVGTAFATFAEDVKHKELRHIGQEELGIALAGSVKRNIGDGMWGIARSKSADEDTDVSPLSAIVMARWGLAVAEPPSGDGPNVFVI
jgi:hypothetical protein